MARRFNQSWIAGSFIQRPNTRVSCLTGLQVSSAFIGHANIRGIAIINSGTTVACVTAVGVTSGDAIFTQMYMAPNAINSGQALVTNVRSVRTSAFDIMIANSIAPTANMPVAWWVIK